MISGWVKSLNFASKGITYMKVYLYGVFCLCLCVCVLRRPLHAIDKHATCSLTYNINAANCHTRKIFIYLPLLDAHLNVNRLVILCHGIFGESDESIGMTTQRHHRLDQNTHRDAIVQRHLCSVSTLHCPEGEHASSAKVKDLEISSRVKRKIFETTTI